MNNGEILFRAEFAKVACGQDAEEFNGVHRFHVAILSEAVATELIGVEERGEAAVHVKRLVVETLEYFTVHV